mgnify:CR=1 FL=1
MEKDLTTLSNEELIKEYKNRRFILGIFIGMVLVMAIASIISILKEKIGASTYVPVAFLPILIIFWNTFNKAKKEMISRKLK